MRTEFDDVVLDRRGRAIIAVVVTVMVGAWLFLVPPLVSYCWQWWTA